MSLAIRINSKNKSSTFLTFLSSLYFFSVPQPFSLRPAILNAEHGGDPSKISNSPNFNPVISKKSKPSNLSMSPFRYGVPS